MNLKNLSAKNKIPKILLEKLKNSKINQIYKKFENSLNINENFIVAVSGGPDSLALAYLAKIYSLRHKLTPKFYIVDHKIRKNSTSEALKVKSILRPLKSECKILEWKGKKPKNNLQSVARKNRYFLLKKQWYFS